MEKLYFFFWSVIQIKKFSSVGVQTCANSLVSPELSSDLVIFMCAVVNYNHVGIIICCGGKHIQK